MTKIKVFEYYNHPEYYRYMSENIFSALETAYKNGFLTVEVSESDFIKMIFEKNIKEKPQLQ